MVFRLISSRHAVRVVLGMEGADDMTIEECRDALSNVDSDAIPFLQLFNLWRSSQAAQAVASSPYLGYIASELLGCGAVRLYQDSLFVKRSSDGPTRWHSDLTMAPFDCNDMVTCWIPLQPVPPQAEGGSSLTFATGSHRDFALPFCESTALCAQPHLNQCLLASALFTIDAASLLIVVDVIEPPRV